MMQLVRSKLQSPGIFYTRVLLHGYQWMKAVFTSRKQRRKQENEGFPISVASNTKALAENEGEGIAKMIYRPDTGEILSGVHIFGLHAADLSSMRLLMQLHYRNPAFRRHQICSSCTSHLIRSVRSAFQICKKVDSHSQVKEASCCRLSIPR